MKPRRGDQWNVACCRPTVGKLLGSTADEPIDFLPSLRRADWPVRSPASADSCSPGRFVQRRAATLAYQYTAIPRQNQKSPNANAKPGTPTGGDVPGSLVAMVLSGPVKSEPAPSRLWRQLDAVGAGLLCAGNTLRPIAVGHPLDELARHALVVSGKVIALEHKGRKARHPVVGV